MRLGGRDAVIASDAKQSSGRVAILDCFVASLLAMTALMCCEPALHSSAAQAADRAVTLYRLHCSGCHGLDGAGSKRGRVPPFAGVVGHFLAEPDGRIYLVRVPGVANSGLPDAQTADVLNYVLGAWGAPDSFQRYSADEVHDIRRAKIDDIVAMRRTLAERLSRKGLSIAW